MGFNGILNNDYEQGLYTALMGAVWINGERFGKVLKGKLFFIWPLKLAFHGHHNGYQVGRV